MICLLVFVAFLGTYIFSIIYSYKYGNLNYLLRPVNSDGMLCGVIPLDDYEYLYYIVREKDKEPRAVCLKECPETQDSPIECHGTS